MFIPFLLLAASVTAPSSPPAPVLSGTTTRSMAEFGQCFTAIEHDRARPYAFVALEDGGRISNASAPGVTAPYSIRFTQGEAANRVQLTMAVASPTETKAVAQAVESCW